MRPHNSEEVSVCTTCTEAAMKLYVLSALVLIIPTATMTAQVWQQTSGTPEGSGVTAMVVREGTGHIFVTTGSFNWPNGDKGGVRRSTDDGTTWVNVSPDAFIARTIEEAADGNLYACIWFFPQDEGLYRSTDNGITWGTPLATVPSGDNIFSVTLSAATTPHTLFAGTRNGPLRSTNNGVNWALAANGMPANSWVRDIEVDSTGVVAAATTNGLFISTNNGDLWEQATGIATGDTIVKLIFDYPLSTEEAGNDTRLLAGSDDGDLYESFWNSTYLVMTLAAVFGDDEITDFYLPLLPVIGRPTPIGVATARRGSSGGGFHISSDKGQTWTQNNNGLPANPTVSALSGRVQNNRSSSIHFFAGLFENVNGGARIFKTTYEVTPLHNWTAQSSGTINDLHGVSFVDASTGTAVGSLGTILSTTTGGSTWIPRSSGTTEDLLDVSFSDANRGTVVGFSGTILRTTNGGASWTPQSSGTMNNLFGVSFSDANTGTAVGQFGTILRTTNGGTNWTPQSGTAENLRGVSFTDANTGTAVAFRDIIRTTDGGANWALQTSGSTSLLYGVSFTDANRGTVVGASGTILSTTDGGATWTPQVSGTTELLDGVSFVDANRGTAVGTNGTILSTTDGGATWIPQTSGTTWGLRAVSFTDPITGTAVGLFGTILLASDGALDVREEEISHPPNDFALEQNYPNPFNPSTTVRFSLPRSGHVALRVFNILGETVATLVNEELNRGTYSTRWNPRGIASGVYFYRLEVGEFVGTRKMLLLR
jgi:photosystem II stability/assembly factor-like uncharacterized protein